MERVQYIFDELRSDLFSKNIEWKFGTRQNKVVYFPINAAGYIRFVPSRNRMIEIMQHPEIKGKGIKTEWINPLSAKIKGREDLDLGHFYIELTNPNSYEINLPSTHVGKVKNLLKKYGFTKQLGTDSP
jgi:uncharacterized protein YqgQ